MTCVVPSRRLYGKGKWKFRAESSAGPHLSISWLTDAKGYLFMGPQRIKLDFGGFSTFGFVQNEMRMVTNQRRYN